ILALRGTETFLASVRDGNWKAWQTVADNVRAIALANLEGCLWACLVAPNGRLRLMSRGDDGAWQDYGDVMDQASIPGGDAPAGIIQLDCTGIGSNLEILALDMAGHLWHATKGAAGWSPFRRMPEAGDTAFIDVDSCNAAGDLHILASIQST